MSYRSSTKLLGHMVYFTLKDRSPEKIAELVEACRVHLNGHSGILSFAVGTLTADLARPVNDRDFDVALQLIFDSRASHDAYQQDPRHLQFIAEQKPNWDRVRVFDADLVC